MSETKFTRRRFLQALPIVAGAVLVAGRPSHADPASWIAIGKLSSFPKGSVKRVTLPPTLNSQVIFVNHEANGTLLALSASCTHRGCIVDWDQADQKFVCPCHHGQFDPTGKNISGPPPSPLPVYATKVDKSGNVLIQPKAGAPAQG